MSPNYPNWYLPVSIPADKEIEFKFIKKDSNGNVIWESNIANRKIKTSSLSTGVLDTETYIWNK